MQVDDKGPDTRIVTAAQKPDGPRRALWRFAELGRKIRLGPNRTILGED